MKPSKKVTDYIAENVLPVYEKQIAWHGLDHIEKVIANSLVFAEQVKDELLNIDMVYVVASYHDIGMSKCYDTHEIVSAEMLLKDEGLRSLFNKEQIETMSQAVADHRASSKNKPRNIYGRILSSADKRWDMDDSLSAMYNHLAKYSPEMTLDEMIEDMRTYAIKKFGKKGYALEKMYFKSAEYENFLKEIQAIAYDKEKFKKRVLQIITQ